MKTLLLLFSFALVELPSPLLCQATHQHQASRVSVAIDGKVHPEQISDNTAIVMLFMTATAPENAPPLVVARCNANIREIGLAPADEAPLREALAYFQEIQSQAAPELKAAFSSATAGSASEATRHRALKQQVQMRAIEQFTGALARMTTRGQMAMRQYLYSMKRQMRVIPQPPM